MVSSVVLGIKVPDSLICSQDSVYKRALSNSALTYKGYGLSSELLDKAVHILPCLCRDAHSLIAQLLIKLIALKFLFCKKNVALVQNYHDRNAFTACYDPVYEPWPERRTFHAADTDNKVHVCADCLIQGPFIIPAGKLAPSLVSKRHKSLTVA